MSLPALDAPRRPFAATPPDAMPLPRHAYDSAATVRYAAS